MPGVRSPSPRTRQVRSQLDHPVIDSDGHTLEFLPAIRDALREVGGQGLVDGFDALWKAGRLVRSLPVEERRAHAAFRLTWWGFPGRNTLDRATAMLPRLHYERMEELGIDYAVLYPTYMLSPLGVDEAELRQGLCRAFNRYVAEAFAEFRDRLTHVALIPMHTPEEAIAELDHAVGALGMKAVLLAGHVFRPVAGRGLPRAARWLDSFGRESPYDYDPVWAKCEELGVSPTFHSTTMGWHRANSQTSYVYNHIGTFAAAGETTCRALFLDGVPKRFPKLHFAFLEGGVGWACSLYADAIGHWEKRNRDRVRDYDPNQVDRGLLRSLFERHASPGARRHLDELEESLFLLHDAAEDPASIDEFARSGVESAQDIRDIFAGRFHFGCEADDPINSNAFDTKVNPLGAKLSIVFGSDIGHWDVPDAREVLSEAYEAVDRGLLGREEFRAFVFENPVALWTRTNPDFFRGTVVEGQVAALRKEAP